LSAPSWPRCDLQGQISTAGGGPAHRGLAGTGASRRRWSGRGSGPTDHEIAAVAADRTAAAAAAYAGRQRRFPVRRRCHAALFRAPEGRGATGKGGREVEQEWDWTEEDGNAWEGTDSRGSENEKSWETEGKEGPRTVDTALHCSGHLSTT